MSWLTVFTALALSASVFAQDQAEEPDSAEIIFHTHPVYEGRCQTKTERSQKTEFDPISGRKLTPFGQGDGAVLLEV